jgi:hypothetical protein
MVLQERNCDLSNWAGYTSNASNAAEFIELNIFIYLRSFFYLYDIIIYNCGLFLDYGFRYDRLQTK